MATEQLTPRPAGVTDVDRMPVHGIDHLELYVGNAAQAAFFFTRAYGFAETAYSGLETGPARPRLARARAGPHPPGGHRHALR